MPSVNFSQQEDSQLVEQIKLRNQSAFDELVKRHQQQVFRFIYFKANDRTEAEGLTQEVFIRVFKSVYGKKKFNLRAKFSTYLLTIAYHIFIDWYRKRPRSPLPVELNVNKQDARSLQPDKTAEESEIITDCLDRLPDEQKTIIILYGRNELSFREIAQVLDKPEGTVKEIYYEKAKPQFQDCLKTKGVDL